MQQIPFSMVLQQQQPQEAQQCLSQSVNNSYYRQFQQLLSSIEQVQSKIAQVDKSCKQADNIDQQQLKQQIRGVLTFLSAKVNEMVVFEHRLSKLVNDPEISALVPQLDQLGKLQARLTSLQAQLQMEQQQCQYYQLQAADYSQKYEVTKRELGHRNVQHGAVEKMAERQISALRANVTALELQTKQLNDEKTQALREKDKMAQKLGEFQIQMTQREEEFNQKISLYKEKFFQATNDGKEQLLAQNKQHQMSLTQAKADNERLQDKLTQLQTTVGSERQEVKKLRDRLAIVQAERDDFFKKLYNQRKRAEINGQRLEEKIKELTDQNIDLEKRLDEKENTAAGLRAEFGGSSRTELVAALRAAEAEAAEQKLKSQHLREELKEANELKDAARIAAQQARLEAESANKLAAERKEQQNWAVSAASRQEAKNLITTLKNEVKELKNQVQREMNENQRLKELLEENQINSYRKNSYNQAKQSYISTYNSFRSNVNSRERSTIGSQYIKERDLNQLNMQNNSSNNILSRQFNNSRGNSPQSSQFGSPQISPAGSPQNSCSRFASRTGARQQSRTSFPACIENSTFISSSPNSRSGAIRQQENQNIKIRPQRAQYNKQETEQYQQVNQIMIKSKQKQEESGDSFDESSEGENSTRKESNSFDDFDDTQKLDLHTTVNQSQNLRKSQFDPYLNNSISKQTTSYNDNMFDNYTELQFEDDQDSPGVFLEGRRNNHLPIRCPNNTRHPGQQNDSLKNPRSNQSTKQKETKLVGAVSSKSLSPIKQFQISKSEKTIENTQEKAKKIKEIVFKPPKQ